MADENDTKDDVNPFSGFQTIDHEGEVTVITDEITVKDDDADGTDANEEDNEDAEDNTTDAEEDGSDAAEDEPIDEDAEGDNGAVDDDDDPEDADGSDDGDTAEDEAEDETDEAEKPKKGSVKQRIKQLTARTHKAENRARSAERRADETAARLEAIEKKLTGKDDGATDDEDGTTDSDGVTKPDPEDKKYKYGVLDPQYIEDLSDYKVDKKFEVRDKKRAEDDAKATSERQAKQWQEKFTIRVEEGSAIYKDFKKVVVDGAEGANPKYALTQDTVLMALDSDVGAQVMYHIAKRPKLAARIAQMSTVGQAIEFGRIEARFDKDKTPKKNKKAPGAAPTPKRAKGGTAAKKINAKTDDFAAFEAQVNRDARKAAKRNQ